MLFQKFAQRFLFVSALIDIHARGSRRMFEKPRVGKKSIANFENAVARFSRITTKILNGVEMMLVEIVAKLSRTTAASQLTR